MNRFIDEQFRQTWLVYMIGFRFAFMPNPSANKTEPAFIQNAK